MIKMRYGTQRESDSNIGEVATLLWSNSDPTASFSAQNVQLEQPASNFMFLRILWQNSTSNDSQHSIDYDLTDIEDYLASSTHARLAFSRYGDTYRFDRSAYFTDETYTELYFYNAIRVTTNSSNVGSNTSQCIPVEIYGVNVRYSGAISQGTGEYDTYTGTYNVTPKANEITTLPTANKLLTLNVTVQEVPYYETSNEQGGYTAYIAQEVDE